MFIFALYFCVFVSVGSQDPCVDYKLLPRAEYRGGNCVFDSNKPTCDKFIDHAWYRATGLTSDLVMQDTATSIFRCGTKFPIWMNGTHPITEGKAEKRTVCQSTSLAADCDTDFEIDVMKCGSFYVYNLSPTGACDEAYCFGGKDVDCPPFTCNASDADSSIDFKYISNTNDSKCTDPCDFFEHTKVDYNAGRSSSCNMHGSSECDKFTSSNWYAFKGSSFLSYLKLSSTCSGPNACGSQFPSWINGTTRLSDGSDANSLCIEAGDDCCYATVEVISKGCNDFTVYQYVDSDVDCLRLCMDDESATCPTTVAPTTANVLKTTSNFNTSSNNSTDGNGSDSTMNMKSAIIAILMQLLMVSI